LSIRMIARPRDYHEMSRDFPLTARLIGQCLV
jgi:hypothetical protein